MEASDILVILAGMVLVVSGVFQILRRYVFLKNSCTAQVAGNILKMERNEKQRDVDSPTTVTYYMNYRYCVDGIEYVKKRMISKRQDKAIGKYNDFTVFYDPSKPKRHYVLQLKFNMLLTLILIAIGVIILYYSYNDVLLLI